MTNEINNEQKLEQEMQNEARMSGMERSISQLSDMMANMHTLYLANQVEVEAEAEVEVEAEVEAEIIVEAPVQANKGKLMRIIVQVREKDMPSLLKEVQDKEEYTMENIEVIDKK